MDLLAVLDRDPEDWPAEMFPVADYDATSRDDAPSSGGRIVTLYKGHHSLPADYDPGCDTTRPLASDHPSGPGLDSVLPMPEPDDERAWTAMLFGDTRGAKS